MPHNHPDKDPEDGNRQRPARQPQVVDSAALLQGQRELLIQHEGETYRLLKTRNGKLILQK